MEDLRDQWRRVAASKVAAGQTIWRSYKLLIYGADAEEAKDAYASGRDSDLAVKWRSSFLKKILSGKINGGSGESSGAGTHWSRSESWVKKLKGFDYEEVSSWGKGCSVLVVLSATYDEADLFPHPEKRHDYNSAGPQEEEVLLNPGAKLTITSASMLWPNEPITSRDNPWGTSFRASPVSIPVSFSATASTASKIAMPSWRGLVNGPVWTEYPGVIIVDKGGGNRQSYEVYLGGEWVTRVARLEEAKAYIEGKLGPCIFRRLKQDPVKTDHYYWGVQDWFGDPSTVYSAEPI